MPVENTDTAVNDDNFFDDVEITDEDLKPQEDDSDSNEEPAPEEKVDSEPEAEPKTEETEEVKPEVKEKTEEPSEEDRKAHNREMAQKRLQEKQEREKATKDYQQQFVAESDKENPNDEAIRQLQVDAYNNKIEFNDNKMVTDYERAVKDFDVLRDPSPEIQAELTAALESFNEAFVTKDQFGNPYEVRGSLYQYLQAKADSITRLTGLGATKQNESKATEKSKASLVPSRAPKEPKADLGLDAFDEEASRW